MGSSAHSGYAFSPAATAPPPGVYVESGNARPEPVGSGETPLDGADGGVGAGGDGELGQEGADVLGGSAGLSGRFHPGALTDPSGTRVTGSEARCVRIPPAGPAAR